MESGTRRREEQTAPACARAKAHASGRARACASMRPTALSRALVHLHAAPRARGKIISPSTYTVGTLASNTIARRVLRELSRALGSHTQLSWELCVKCVVV